MAKKLNKQARRVVKRNLARLGFSVEDRDLEIRFDPIAEDNTKAMLVQCENYGVLRITKRRDRLWAAALTDLGLTLVRGNPVHGSPALKVEAIAQDDDHDTLQSRALTEEELRQRKDERDEDRAESFGQENDQWDAGGIRPIDVPADMAISTLTLRSFQERATARGMSRVLTQESLASLSPNASHRIRQAFHHTSHEGHTNIRAEVQLQKFSAIHGDEGVETSPAWIDFREDDWDLLLVPYKNRQREQGIARGGALYLTTPKWEAVRSYNAVHELHSIYQGHLSAYERDGYLGTMTLPSGFRSYENGNGDITLRGQALKEFLATPRVILGAEILNFLHIAHPVVIDPEWVGVQEEWTHAEAWAYADRVVLPYDPLYLDFEGPGGRLHEQPVWPSLYAPLTGCIFWTHPDTGRLIITPIGGRSLLDRLGEYDGPMSGLPYEMTGNIVIGREVESGTPSDWDEHVIYHALDSGSLESEYTLVNLPSARGSGQEAPFGIDPDRIMGYSELPLTPAQGRFTLEEHRLEDDPRPPNLAGMWTNTLQRQAVKSLTMLSLLDNENVELRPYPVSRQVRRNVEREQKKGRDIGIASEIVVVRKHRYIDGKRVQGEEGNQVEYSHQFRVRRHEQHHGPHTPAYRAHPEKAKPCGRCGSCRRFVVESYIKGPQDKPLKDHKTYVFRDKSD